MTLTCGALIKTSKNASSAPELLKTSKPAAVRQIAPNAWDAFDMASAAGKMPSGPWSGSEVTISGVELGGSTSASFVCDGSVLASSVAVDAVWRRGAD